MILLNPFIRSNLSRQGESAVLPQFGRFVAEDDSIVHVAESPHINRM
jgi:hypothetical protein